MSRLIFIALPNVRSAGTDIDTGEKYITRVPAPPLSENIWRKYIAIANFKNGEMKEDRFQMRSEIHSDEYKVEFEIRLKSSIQFNDSSREIFKVNNGWRKP